MSSAPLSSTDLHRLAMGARLSKLHVAFPARVERVDGPRVDVRPETERATECRDGSTLHEELPVIAAVPLAFPRTESTGLAFPVSVGDYVLIVCCDRSLGEWLRTGRRERTVDVGVHTLDGAVAIPGLFPDASAFAPDHLVLGSFGSGPSIHVDGDHVRVGGDGADQQVPHGNAWKDAFTALAGLMKTWVTAVDGIVSPGTPLPSTTPLNAALDTLDEQLALSERVRVT